MNYCPYFTKKEMKGILKTTLNFSYFLLENKKRFQEGLQRPKGLCFSYLFCFIIASSVLHQCPKSLVLEVMVSSLDLFHDPSFIVVFFSAALKVFNPRAKAKYRLCRVQCRSIVMDLSCKVILLEWLLTLYLKHIKG